MYNKILWLPGLLRQLLFYICSGAFVLACTSCGSSKPQKFQAEFDGLFDTHSEIIGYAGSQNEFTEYSDKIYSEMTEYSRLFDIYNNYEGINNLKTINDKAGVEPVAVDDRIILFLEFCINNYHNVDKKVNIAMGSVLTIWHDFRERGNAEPEKAALPNMSDLRAASLNMDINDLIIDITNKTVFLKKSGMSLDVGAAAKGYASKLAADAAKAIGMTSALIDIGGNVVAVGKPLDGVRERWGVGIQDPRPSANGSANILDTVFINDCAVVTSGDYERYYIVAGIRYNHIIDPETLMPARKFASVTVIHLDSGIADELSTALFITDEMEGREICKRNNAEAIWVNLDGKITYTDGYKAISKIYGGYSSVDS